VKRHLDAQLGGRVDALEVDVHHLLLPRMHLEVAQQHLLRVAPELHLEDRRMEGLLLQRMEQRVVIDLDRARLARAIDDARHLAGIAQAAARSGPLQCALESDEFHVSLQVNEPPRPGDSDKRSRPGPQPERVRAANPLSLFG